jgi:trans-aconitate methyltransferase
MNNGAIRKIAKHLIRQLMGDMHIGARTRKMHILREIKKFNFDGKLILDAGCGKGDYVFIFANKYPHATIEGIEIDQVNYEICNQQNGLLKIPNATFKHHDLCESFGNEKYDFICSVDVLEHIEEDGTALKNMFSALRSDGLLLIHVPLIAEPFFKRIRKMERQPDHVRDGYEEVDLLKKIRNNGFIIKEKKYTFALYRGALAWEVWKMFSKMNILIQILLHPFLVFWSWTDGVVANKSGSGILVLAQKR